MNSGKDGKVETNYMMYGQRTNRPPVTWQGQEEE